MRICLINSAPGWGGGERMFLELARGLAQAGHVADVVCRPGSVLAQRVPPEIGVYRYRCHGDLDIATLWRLFRLFRAQRYDAVFCNMGRDCMLAGFAALPLRIPVIRVRALAKTHRSARNRLIYRRLLSAVVAVSAAVRDGLLALHVPAARVHVIANGIEVAVPNMSRRRARADLGAADTDFVVVFAGRLVPEKGADWLPDIATQVLAAGVPLRLLIAGDGPLRSALAVRCRVLAPRVTLLGFQDDVAPLLLAADAVLMPSRTEAFPVTALEALMLGAPLVASGVGGLLELVGDSRCAVLAVPEPTAVAQALIGLYHSPDQGHRLREAGRLRAQAFTRSRMIAAYVRLVQQLRQPSPQAADGIEPLQAD